MNIDLTGIAEDLSRGFGVVLSSDRSGLVSVWRERTGSSAPVELSERDLNGLMAVYRSGQGLSFSGESPLFKVFQSAGER